MSFSGVALQSSILVTSAFSNFYKKKSGISKDKNICCFPVPHLQEERVDSVYEEENEGHRETVSGQ